MASKDKGKGLGKDAGFKGNKQSLPAKPCVACGRPMTWRKRWEKNWDEVKYCSDACRRRGSGPLQSPGPR